MSGVRKASSPSGIIPLDPDAISRTIRQGVRRMERDPHYRQATTLHPRRPAPPPAPRHSDLGRSTRLFGSASHALRSHAPQRGGASATHGRGGAVRPQPSVGLAYHFVSGTRQPAMIPVFGSRQEVSQALRRGEIQADTVVRLQRSPRDYFECRAGLLASPRH